MVSQNTSSVKMTIWPQFNSIRQKWKQSVKSEQLDKSEQCSKSMQLFSHDISLFAVQYWISKNFIIHRETRRLKRWPSYSKDSVWLRLRLECKYSSDEKATTFYSNILFSTISIVRWSAPRTTNPNPNNTKVLHPSEKAFWKMIDYHWSPLS